VLVLLSFVLVLVATVLLVLGLLVSDDGINLIYFSIGMSAIAAVLLIVAVRKSKPAPSTATGPAPLQPEPEPTRELATVGAPSAPATSQPPPPSGPPVAAAAAAVPQAPPPVETPSEWLASDSEWGDSTDDWDGEGEVEFPISDYDDLTIDAVLPLLPQLYSDELDVVEERERQGLNRRDVLNKLAELRITGTEADATVDDEEDVDEADAGPAWEPDDALVEEPAVDDEAIDEPVAGYDTMAVSEIIGLVGELDDSELDLVREHEVATKNRRTVLAAIDRRIGTLATAPPPVAPRRAPAPPPRKVAPAKKAPAKKAAPPPAKAAPGKKAAPAKKAPAKKAPAKKAPAVKKAAPLVRKAGPIKKAPVKKAPAAKKAAKRR